MPNSVLTVDAPAKINLGLEVVARREDGYHEVVTVLQTISLVDRFIWTPDADAFRYEGPQNVPASHDIVRTVLESGVDRETWRGRLRLSKEIPVAAGLGGGSSDSVVALRLAKPSLSDEELIVEARRLGSDASFFVRGGTALATGRGSDLESLPTPHLWFVIVMPRVRLVQKTRTMYKGLTAADMSDGRRTRELATAMDVNRCTVARFPNAFERQMRSIERVAAAWDLLEQISGRPVNLSGAGPALFVLADDQASAEHIAEQIAARGSESLVAHSLPAGASTACARKMAAAMRELNQRPTPSTLGA